MQLQTLTPRRLAGIAGYLLVGLAGTAGLVVAVLRWAAAAISGLPGALPRRGPLDGDRVRDGPGARGRRPGCDGIDHRVADYLDSRGDRLRPILTGLSVGIVATLGVLVCSALLGLMGFLITAGVFVVTESLWLRRCGAWWSLATFLGGVPALAFLLLVIGVGLG